MNLPYSLQLATQSLFRDKWINLLSILTITSGLLIISIAFLSVYNIDIATKKLPDKFSMIIYLDDNVPSKKIDSMINSIQRNDAVHSVKYISKEEALKDLKSTFKDSNFIFEGLDENPLPDTLEVKLRKETLGLNTAEKLRDEALEIEGISEVEYGKKILSSIHYIKIGTKTIGTTLIVILSIVIIFVCYSSVKILFYRRKAEIETFKLLGATKGFIRAPFIIEGAIIGAGGGFLSLIGIFAFYYIILLKLSITIPILNAILFPTNIFILLPLLGLFLGITGAFIALGRLRY